MNRILPYALSFMIAVTISACSFNKQPTASNTSNQPAQSENKQSPAKAETTPPPTQPGELQPGQASGTYTAKGEVVELKYAYAGRAVRFSTESLVILLTDKPIPADAVAEEIKSPTLLESEKIRGLEYVIEENGMWVRFHPSQYQESGSMKLKEYKVENEIVRGVDENDGSLTDGKYSRSVKFVAAITK
ncbi:MAG TPA: hypothetical protein VJU86_16870 [Pyrinomonadaceae bacterium]|nr:hypothetical protein [Pyrinomonadaceae bacterium]